MEQHFQDVAQKVPYDKNSDSLAALLAKHLTQKKSHNNVARLCLLE